MSPIKAGWKTSEFWATVVAAGIGGAMAIPDAAPTWKVVAGAICAVLPVMFYASSRTALKQAQIDAAPATGSPP